MTTRVGDNEHYVADGVNGHLVPVDDSAATAQALMDVLDSSRWDATRISSGLPIGDWADVGARVIEFFRERLAQLRGTPIRRLQSAV